MKQDKKYLPAIGIICFTILSFTWNLLIPVEGKKKSDPEAIVIVDQINKDPGAGIDKKETLIPIKNNEDVTEAFISQLNNLSILNIYNKLVILSKQLPEKSIIPVLIELEKVNPHMNKNDLEEMIIKHWSTLSFTNSLDYIYSNKSNPKRYSLAKVIIKQSFPLNPSYVIEKIESMDDVKLKNFLINIIIEIWSKDSPNEAFAYIEKIESIKFRMKLVKHIINQNSHNRLSEQHIPNFVKLWVNMHTQAAAEWIKELPPEKINHESIQYLIAYWVKIDSNAALSWAQSLRTKEKQLQATEYIFQNLALHSPENAFRLIENFPRGQLKDSSLNNLIQNLTNKSPEDVSGWIMSLKVEHERKNVIMKFANTWAIKDPGKAAELINIFHEKLNKGTFYPNIIKKLTRNWSIKEPYAAIQWMETLEDREVKNLAINNIFLGWSESQPRAALGWIKTTKYPDKAKVISDLFRTWSSHSPEQAAFALVNEVDYKNKPFKFKHNVVMNLVNNWKKSDPSFIGIQNWLGTLPDNYLDKETIDRLAIDLSTDNPAKAAELLAGHISKSDHSHGYIAFHWARKDLEAAKAWASQLTEKQEKRKSFSAIARVWAKKDLPEATVWANAIYDDDMKKKIIGDIASFVSRHKGQDKAIDWLRDIPSGKIRDNAVNKIISKSRKNQDQIRVLISLIENSAKREFFRKQYPVKGGPL